MTIRGRKEEFNSSREYRNEIRNILSEGKNYLKSYNLCLTWLDGMKKKILDINQNDMWACYYNMSVSLWGLKQYKEAIKNLNKSLQHVKSDIDGIKSNIMIAGCYEELGNIEMSLKSYQEGLELCDYNNGGEYIKTKASLLKSIGDILGDESYFYQSIKIYKSVPYIDDETDRVIKNKIDSNYKSLFSLYIKNNCQTKANDVLNNIFNTTLKYELRNEMYGEIAVANIL